MLADAIWGGDNIRVTPRLTVPAARQRKRSRSVEGETVCVLSMSSCATSSSEPRVRCHWHIVASRAAAPRPNGSRFHLVDPAASRATRGDFGYCDASFPAAANPFADTAAT